MKSLHVNPLPASRLNPFLFSFFSCSLSCGLSHFAFSSHFFHMFASTPIGAFRHALLHATAVWVCFLSMDSPFALHERKSTSSEEFREDFFGQLCSQLSILRSGATPRLRTADLSRKVQKRSPDLDSTFTVHLQAATARNAREAPSAAAAISCRNSQLQLKEVRVKRLPAISAASLLRFVP